MPRRQDDQASWESGSRSGGRSVLLTVGLALAVAATAASFLTDDPRYLRLAVVAAAWGFVAAAFAATRRRGEHQAVTAREAEVRRSYERELDLELATRREYELELESDLRRETDDAVRSELAALRADVAALSALRGDLAAVGQLREELGQLGGLRAEIGRLRTELTEQLDGELLIERIIMRTQAFRRAGEPAPAPGAPAAGGGWSTDLLDADLPEAELPAVDAGPSRALTGSPTALRWDEPRPTREYETVRPVRAAAPSPREWLADRALVEPAEAPWTGPSRHAAAEPARSGFPPAPPEAPATDDLSAPSRPIPHRRRRTDGEAETDPARALSAERPAAAPAHPDSEPRTNPGGTGEGVLRVSDLLAENGGTPPAGSRRHRRYRDEDEPDDVLARVLGQQ